MVVDRLSGGGVSLLSLYGDNVCRYPKKKMVMKIHANSLVGMEGDERLGKFLPGLMKAVKKVGKVTSGITTGLAKAVGVPQSAINALAKIDPTKKKPSAAAAITALTTPEKTVVAVPKSMLGFDKKKVLIVGGAAVGGLVLLKIITSHPSR